MGILDMDLTAFCATGAHILCYGSSATCTCECHADDEQTYGGYATPEEYYDEWGWP